MTIDDLINAEGSTVTLFLKNGQILRDLLIEVDLEYEIVVLNTRTVRLSHIIIRDDDLDYYLMLFTKYIQTVRETARQWQSTSRPAN